MFSFSRNQSKTINIPNIGPVLFEKSKRAKHINISVKPPAKIRVAVPRGISYKKAASFASTKVNWIKKTLHEMSFRQKNSVKLQPVKRNEAKQLVMENDLLNLSDYYVNDFCEFMDISKDHFFEVIEKYRNHDIWHKDAKGRWIIPGHLKDNNEGEK